MMKSQSVTNSSSPFPLAAAPEGTSYSFPSLADRPLIDTPPAEETLVIDDRAALSPAQVVESKLTRMLKEATLPVSHLQMRGLLRSR